MEEITKSLVKSEGNSGERDIETFHHIPNNINTSHQTFVESLLKMRSIILAQYDEDDDDENYD